MAERRALRGACREAGQPLGLYRPVLAGRADRRAEERGTRPEGGVRTGRGVFRRAARARAPALHPGERLPDLRDSRSGRTGGRLLRAGGPARACRGVRLYPRRAAPHLPRPGPGEHRGRRAGRTAARCALRCGPPGARSGTVPRAGGVLPVRRRYRHLRAARHLPRLHRDAHRRGRGRSRAVARATVRSARHAGGRTRRDARRGPRAVPLRQRRPVRGASADLLVRRGDARGAAGRLPVRLVEHLARDLRRAVPVGDGPRGTPRPRGSLHDREEHPQVDRAAVHGRPAGRVRAPEGEKGSSPPCRASAFPAEARTDDVLRPRVRLRQLPHHRLP